MDDITQTLIRAVLKIGAGYFVSKGFTDSNTAEAIVAGGVGLAAVIWGVWHRTPKKEGTV